MPHTLHPNPLAGDASRVVSEIGVPPCPAVLTGLIRESRADDPDFKRVAALISQDVALSATLLKTANSALYASAAAPLDSIPQALLRVGLRNTVQLVTGLLLRQAFTDSGGADLDEFWESSAKIAEISARIAHQTRAAERETAFSFGLFRDCGQALMLRQFPDYPRLQAATLKMGKRLTDVEQARYGATHAQVGFATARGWLLPEPLCAAVLHHHSPDAQRGRRGDLSPASMKLIALGALAEAAYRRGARQSLPAEVETAADLAAAQLGVAPAALEAFAAVD